MIFTTPTPLEEALARLAERRETQTVLSSAEINTLHQDVLDRAFFSARTNHLGYLQDAKHVVQRLLDGEINQAAARALLQDRLDALEYDPERGGFAGERKVEPAERGSLRDLSSDSRLDLLLETNVRQAANFGAYTQAQSDFSLHAYPAWELVRLYPREVPRGSEESKTSGWPERWRDAGGQFFDGRMIARKDAEVWNQLGSRALFDDGLGQPYPPFAFRSGYGTREVPREEAVALGVIGAEDKIEGNPREFNEALEIAADFDPEFLDALSADLDVAVSEGRAKLKGGTR